MSLSLDETQPLTSQPNADALRGVFVGQLRPGALGAIAVPGSYPRIYEYLPDATDPDDGLNFLNTLSSEGGTLPGRWGLTNLGPPVSPTGVTAEKDIFSPTDGQTIFTLSHVPTQPNSMNFTVNGQGQTPGLDYTLVGNTLTFLNSSFVMEAGWTVVATYF